MYQPDWNGVCTAIASFLHRSQRVRHGQWKNYWYHTYITYQYMKTWQMSKNKWNGSWNMMRKRNRLPTMVNCGWWIWPITTMWRRTRKKSLMKHSEGTWNILFIIPTWRYRGNAGVTRRQTWILDFACGTWPGLNIWHHDITVRFQCNFRNENPYQFAFFAEYRQKANLNLLKQPGVWTFTMVPVHYSKIFYGALIVALVHRYGLLRSTDENSRNVASAFTIIERSSFVHKPSNHDRITSNANVPTLSRKWCSGWSRTRTILYRSLGYLYPCRNGVFKKW